MSLNIKNKNSSDRPSINEAPEGMTGPGYEHSSPIYANIRVAAGFLLMTLGTAAMYIGMVGLKPVALEFGITRSLGALPYALFMVVTELVGLYLVALLINLGLSYLY